MIQQFIYTASPWGKTGAGWMVFQQSRNISSDVIKKLYEVYRYEEPKYVDGTTAYPLQFAYFPNHNGKGAVLSQTAFTGMRWWGDPRSGDFFAYVLLLDEDAVLQSSWKGVNPVRLFKSSGMLTGFPEDLRDKALRIFRKEIPWEPPPDLDELSSLVDLPENPQLAFDAALEAIPEHAMSKLGALVRAIIMRTTKKTDNPIVFDSNNKHSLFMMSVAMDLIPPDLRKQTWFAVHFHESALRRLPCYSSLTFYGTDTSQPCDPDTGIVSGVDFTQNPFGFENRVHVRAFKKQLDSMGAEVSYNEYNKLVDCRKLLYGKSTDLNELRVMMAFAGHFAGLKDEMVSELAMSFPDTGLSVQSDIPDEYQKLYLVAWFEFHIKAFEDRAKQLCTMCMQNVELLEKVPPVLNDDETRVTFLNEVSKKAVASGAAAFANQIVDLKITLKDLLEKLPEGGLLRLALNYGRVKRILDDKGLPDDISGELGRVEQLLIIAGNEVRGISDVVKKLKYLLALNHISSIDDVKLFLQRYVANEFPQDVDIKKDILDKVEVKSENDAKEVVELGIIMSGCGLDGGGVILAKWNEDQRKLGDCQIENNRLKMENNRLQVKVAGLEESNGKQKKKPCVIFIVIACVVGIVLGCFAGMSLGNVLSAKLLPNLFRIVAEPDGNAGKLDETDKETQPLTPGRTSEEVDDNAKID